MDETYDMQKDQHREYVSIPYPKPGIKETRVFTTSKAVVRVHIPDLDPEENERRMRLFKKAAEDFLRALIKTQEASKSPRG